MGGSVLGRAIKAEHVEARIAGLGIRLADDLEQTIQKLVSRRDTAAHLIEERRRRRDTFRDDDQVRAEAEIVALADSMFTEASKRALFISNTRVLDDLPGFEGRITITADALFHWITAVLTAGAPSTTFQAMVTALYQQGVVLFDRATFRATFEPLVSAAEERFKEVLTRHRGLMEELLGPKPEEAFAEVTDFEKPSVLRNIEGRLADRLERELALERRKREDAERVHHLSQEERTDYERLKGRKRGRHAKGPSDNK